MTRTVFLICIAIGALGLGACEKHSADDLPDHYKHKGAGAGKAPAHGGHDKAPADPHKG
jgi:hypothetical protein